MANIPEYNKRSPDVSSGIYNSGEKTQNNIVFPESKPQSPTQFSATNGEYTDKVVLSWYPQQDAVLYIVYRDSENIANLKPEELDSTTNGLLSYDDTSAVPGTIYDYYIKTRFGSIESEKSNSDTGSKKLTAPQIVTASYDLSRDYIELNWSSVSNATTYKVYRIYRSLEEYKLESPEELLITTTDTKYYDYTPNPGEEVNYYIVSSTGYDETDSDPSTFVTGRKTNNLQSPTVTASRGTYFDKVFLTWSGISNATKYGVYRDGQLIVNTTLQSFSDTSAIPGKKHQYYVIAYDQYGSSEVSTDSYVIGVRRLLAPNCTVLTDVENLSETQIKIKWTASEGEVYRYQIFRGTTFVNPTQNMSFVGFVNGNVYEFIDSTETDAFDITNNTLQHDTTYYYTVVAIAEDGDGYGDSSFGNFSSGRLKTPTPSAPENVTATQGEYTDQIIVSWDTTTYASYYLVYRDNVQIASITGTTYADSTSLVSCSQYQYNIKAVNSLNNSSISSEPAFGFVSLSKPTGLSATDNVKVNINDATEIRITWNSVVGATGYKVYRSTQNSLLSMTQIATTGTNSYVDAVDTDLLQGIRYYYSVKAYCALNDSQFSNIDSGILDTAPADQSPPYAPINLIATDGLLSKISLTWNDSITDEVSTIIGYKIFRNDIQIGITTNNSYDDSTITPGTSYTYKVKAYNVYGDSNYSNSDTGYAKLNTPTGVTVNINNEDPQTIIKINWNSVIGASSYTIYRGVTTSSLTELATITDLEYYDTNTDLQYDTTYFYKVRANSGVSGAQSSLSSIVFGSLESPLPEPFNINVESGLSSDGIKINWDPSQYAYGGYKIIRDDIEIAEGPANYFTYSDDLNTSDLYPPDGWGKYSGTTPTPSTFSLAAVALNSSVVPSNFSISTNNGTKITFTADSDNGIYHLMPESVQVGEIYTASVYAVTESGEVDFVIGYNDGENVVSGSFVATTTPQRFTFTFRTTSNKFNSNIFIGNNNLSSGQIIFFGAQLEKGLVATEYIQTQSEPIIATSFIDTDAYPETVYTYKVLAQNSTGQTQCNSSVTGIRKNQTPVILSASYDKSDIIRLEIDTQLINNLSTLTIYRGSDQDESDNTEIIVYSLLETVSVTNPIIIYNDDDVSLEAEKKYYYKVKTTYGGVDSDLSEPVYGEITGLEAPYDSSDYEVFALDMCQSGGFWDINFSYPKSRTDGKPPQNGFDISKAFYSTGVEPYIKFVGSTVQYNTDYPYKGVVPSPAMPYATGSELNGVNGTDGFGLTSFNGLRSPNSRQFEWVGNIPTYFTGWANIMKLIPSGRRWINARMWNGDSNIIATQTLNYYKEKTTDGISYPNPSNCASGVNCSKRYLGPWLIQMASDSKAHFNSFLNRCKQQNLIFDYIQGDRENYSYYHYLNGKMTNIANTEIPITQTATELGYYNVGDTTLNVKAFSDPRVIDAITNDSRFYDPTVSGSLHPITNKCFADDFYDAFCDLWRRDPFYSTKPIPEGLTWQDILFLFRETDFEKQQTQLGSTAATMVSSLSVTSNSFRVAPINYYVNSYRCNTGAGTNESRPNTSCPCEGLGLLSTQTGGPTVNNPASCSNACGPLGAENWQLKYAITGTIASTWTTSYFRNTNYSDLKNWYINWIHPNPGTDGLSTTFPTGYPKLTGYTLFHFAVNAWNSVMFNWLHNYIGDETFNEVWKSTSPEYNHVKYMNYSNGASTASEAPYFQMSNNDRSYRLNLVENTTFTGFQSYGGVGNIILDGSFNALPPKDGSVPGTAQGVPATVTSDRDRAISYNNSKLKVLSGYVKNPQTDYERYAWQKSGGADLNFNFDGRCNTNNLIRYPETKLIDNSGNWIPALEKAQTPSSTLTIDKWYTEIIYKVLVDDIKKARLQLRSTKSYSPWTNSAPDGYEKGIYKWSFGYWYELIYHFILNKTGPLNLWDEFDYGTGNRKYIQKALDEWRNVSKNTKPIPCSNSTGDVTLPVDRILLADAFEKCLISGGKLELPNSTQYIWRITVPPKFFDPATGKATLQRIPSGAMSDDDLPEFIEIDSTKDTPSSNNYHNSRGVWVKRNIATPPKYIPVVAVQLNAFTDSTPYNPEEDLKNNETGNVIIKLTDIEDQSCSKCLDGALKERNEKIAKYNKEYAEAVNEIVNGIRPDGSLIPCDQTTQYGSKPQYCCTSEILSNFIRVAWETAGLDLVADLLAWLGQAGKNFLGQLKNRYGFAFRVDKDPLNPNEPSILEQLEKPSVTNYTQDEFFDLVLKNILTEDTTYLSENGYIEALRNSRGEVTEWVLTSKGKEELARAVAGEKITTLFGRKIEGSRYQDIIQTTMTRWLEARKPSSSLPSFYRPELPINSRNIPWYLKISPRASGIFKGLKVTAFIKTGIFLTESAVPLITAVKAIIQGGGFSSLGRILVKALKDPMSRKNLGKILLKAGVPILILEIWGRMVLEYIDCVSTGDGALEAINQIYQGNPKCRNTPSFFNPFGDNCCKTDGDCAGGKYPESKCLGKIGEAELEYLLAVQSCCEGICEMDVQDGRITQKPAICDNLPEDPRCKKPPVAPPIYPDTQGRDGPPVVAE